MWRDRLKTISDELKEYEECINSGVSKSEAIRFCDVVQSTFNGHLPSDYLAFLETVNGLDFNGFVLYGVDQCLLEHECNQVVSGFIELNEIWRENEWERELFFLGESNISWYAYCIDDKKYYEMDNPSGREMNVFDFFDDFMDKILSDSLL